MAENEIGRDAGDFATWLDRVTRAIREGEEMDVPCGGCTACCTSSQFVTIEPDERDALAAIPAALVFPAPGRAGSVVLGYDEHGRCPMLADHGCSIYEQRPRACRTYDCRVFAGTGVAIEDPSKRAITDRVRRWRFRYAAPADRARHDALRADAARSADPNPTSRAIAAIAGNGSPRGAGRR